MHLLHVQTCSLYMQQMHWLWQSSSGEVAASPGAPALPATDRTADAYAFPTTPVKVSYRLGPREYLWDGRLDRYDGAGLDQQTRMVPCRVHVDSPLQVETVVAGVVMANAATVAPPTLMSGMFVQVRIHAQPDVPLLRLPNEALQPGNTVWVVREGRLHKCHVRVADMRDDRDHVLIYEDSGSPAAGDQVVSSPLSAPVEDMTVRVQSP